MAGLSSSAQNAVREDLSDVITLADQRNTPLFSLLPKGSEPTNFNLFSYQFEKLLAPKLTGSLSDADRVEFENHSSRLTLSARCKIIERAPKVGRVAEAINDAAGVGKKREMARAIANAIIVAKRDIEVSLGSGLDSAAESGETPAQMRGMFNTPQAGSQTDTATIVPTDARTPADQVYTGAWTGVTEDLIRDTILGSVWDETGTMDSYQLVVGRALKSLITSWMIYDAAHVSSSSTPLRRFEQYDNEDEMVLKACVGAIEGDFGRVEITPSAWLRYDIEDGTTANRTLRNRSGIGFKPEMHSMRFNQMPAYRPFQDTGGGPRGLIEAIVGREDRNPKTMIAIAPAS